MPAFTAVPLTGWVEPSALFDAVQADFRDVFWLDAGAAATEGWSYLGEGARRDDPALVRGIVCAPEQEDGAARSGVGPWPAGPFRGGHVGWFGYEPGAAAAGAPTAQPDDGIPAEVWLRAERFVAFDHAAHRMWAVGEDELSAAWAARIASLAAEAVGRGIVPVGAAAPVPVTGRDTPDAYAAMIERCRDAIREGDAYQLCLTTRFQTSSRIDPIAAYARLRASSPTHHGGFIRCGETALLSASPEQFLAVRGGTVQTRPIKGTRPRGADRASDDALAAELRASAKERAENVMIVDLMRNDLSRVSVPGTIRVDRLLEVESYAPVHQLVSTVSGTLAPQTTVGDVLAAAFPAGSMTGAPKLSAMSILHTLERGPRGVYSGCFGYIGDDGDLDVAMVIRSILTHATGAYVGAGGGITWKSDAADEVAEVGVKARAPLAAVGGILPDGW